MKPLTLNINGKSWSVMIDEHETLSHVLRDKIGLTGTKSGCDQGSCGACTVIANNKAVLSCITPAIRFDNATILTIEGVAETDSLSALQNKLVEKGAVQCGFCTPGMVMTAIDYLNKHDNASKQEITEAISGNLCRCTGYKKIIEAITEYAAERKTKGTNVQQPPNGFSHVGKGRPYSEAERKVNGSAEYTDDIAAKNALHARFLRSKFPHALIDNIDVQAALKLPGVRGILTGKDLPIAFGVLPISQDETAMAIRKTRYVGEIVAAVAADTIEIAEKALSLIKVEYTPIHAFLEIQDSLDDAGTNETIHQNLKFNNNIHKKAQLSFGDREGAFEKSEVVVESKFRFEGISHGFTEPHAAIASWDENGLTLTTATQVPHYLHRALSKVLELPLSRIRVIKPFVGGGFGGKSDPFPHEIIISELARRTKRTVRTRLSREEVFLTNHGRHPSEMTVKIGSTSDGTLTALDADISIDGGAYGSFGVVTSYYNGVLLQAPYKLENFGFKTARVYTNKPQCGAMRGHGAVNSRYAVETLIDEIAHKIDIDPVDMRMKNFLPPNSMTVGQYRITSNGSRESLLKVADQSMWKAKHGKLPYGQGLGVACGFFISGSALPIIRNDLPQSTVHLKLDFDGRVLISSGASDIGQGSDTMLAMIVAEVLGISFQNVFVIAADTLLTPVDLGSYSSRVTFMAGNAAKDAAENLKQEMIRAVAAKHNIPAEHLRMGDEHIYSEDGSVNITWLQAVEILTAHRGAVTVSGKYISPKLGGDFKGSGAGLSPSYSFGACAAEVSVDINTGQVSVLKIWGAHDCGKAINPLAVEGQLEGSWHMGLGQAVSEQMKYHEGLHLNNNFLDYKIPTSMDTPPIITNYIETIDPEGPFGAKECGEGALHPVLPAIANAIYDAVGVRITQLPISPEQVLAAIRKSKKSNLVNLETNE